MTAQQTLQTEEYKQTELGELPKEWEVVRLDSISKIGSGGSAPQGEKYFHGKNPFIRVQHLNLESYSINNYDLITEEAVKKYKLKLFPKGTIVFPKSGASIYSEKRAMLPFDAYVVSHLCTIQATNKINRNFLYFFLRGKKLAEKKAETYPTLNLFEIKELQIPLPPLPEQQKIASVLSTVQDAQEKTDKYIDALKELKKSLMKHLFTYGAVSFEDADKVELKQTEIGMIPKDWEVVKFEDCLSDDRIKVSKLQQSQFKKIGKYPIVDQSQDLISGYWDNQEDLFSSPLPVVIFGDHTRTFKYIDFPFVCGPDGTKILIPNISKAHPRYFYYYLKLLTIPSRGYNRHYSLLKDYLIPLPSLPEQQRIASILSAIDEKIQAEEQKEEALKETFNSLLKNLMTAKIRVNNLEVEA